MRNIGILVIVFISIFLSGCQKLLDYYDPEGKKSKPPCRISKITHAWTNAIGYPYLITYRYDALKRPVSMEDNEEPEVMSGEWFEYDNQGRLHQHSRTYYFTELTSYVYEGDARLPVRDTLYDFAGRKYVETFIYDDLNRIVSIEKKFHSVPEDYPYELYGDPLSEESVTTYYYDVRGNRQQFGAPLRYSDKPSLDGLHPVWQLVSRNYSKNDLQNSARTFNDYGLPLTFEGSTHSIEYICD